MATGERRFTTEDRKVEKFQNQLLPNKDWDGRVLATKAEIRYGEDSGLPYINVPFEAVGSALKEGGNNRWVYHRFFLGLNPGKDGKVNVDRPNGLTAFAKSIGVKMDLGANSIITLDTKNGPVDAIDPQAVKRWLQDQDGAQFRFRTKVEKGQDGYPDKNVVSYFIEVKAGADPFAVQAEVSGTQAFA